MPSVEHLLGESRLRWTAAAPAWDRDGDVIAAATRAATEALLDAAPLRPGMRVLDVAGGTGDPSLSVAALVGPEGRVACADLTPAMLAAARRRAEAAGVGRLDPVAASAEFLPFRSGGFDAVLSRFGVMLFADPPAAVREMARVARPGATVAAVVWGTRVRNPYLEIPVAVAERVGGIPRTPPGAPSVFRFGAAGAMRTLLRGAGLFRVDEGRREFTLEVAVALEEFWPFVLRMATPLRVAVETRPGAVQAALAAAVAETVAPYCTAGVMRFPAEIVLASGVA